MGAGLDRSQTKSGDSVVENVEKCEKCNVTNNLSLPESGGLGSSLRSLRSCPQVSSKTVAKPGGERRAWPRSGRLGLSWVGGRERRTQMGGGRDGEGGSDHWMGRQIDSKG
jgi:hypothetical protein